LTSKFLVLTRNQVRDFNLDFRQDPEKTTKKIKRKFYCDETTKCFHKFRDIHCELLIYFARECSSNTRSVNRWHREQFKFFIFFWDTQQRISPIPSYFMINLFSEIQFLSFNINIQLKAHPLKVPIIFSEWGLTFFLCFQKFVNMKIIPVFTIIVSHF
jgi:hypothetical protein